MRLTKQGEASRSLSAAAREGRSRPHHSNLPQTRAAELRRIVRVLALLTRRIRSTVRRYHDLPGPAPAHDAEYLLTLRNDPTGMQTCLESLAGVRTARREENTGQPTYRVLFDSPEPDTGPLLQSVLERDGMVVGLAPVERQLDEAFMDLTEPGVRE